MIEKIVVPVLGESITEATVAKWLKNPGDSVVVDEPIVELETDKVNLEVPSPITGVLSEINSKDGSVVEVGALLGSVSDDGVSENPLVKKKVQNENADENNVIKLDTNKKEPRIFENKAIEKQEKEKPLVLTEEVVQEASVKKETNQTLSPAVRKIVVENEIDVNSIQGSGKDGNGYNCSILNITTSSLLSFSLASNKSKYTLPEQSITFLILELSFNLINPCDFGSIA